MCDKLVFDLAQEIEGSPSVFVRKDWLNILDNQNQNYNNNQSVIDTSQLSNSNKWMNYREAYFSIPFLITLGQSTAPTATISGTPAVPVFNTAASSVDYAYGLKNWFGQIIHSFTLDYNGTTIIQQTPYSSMWNSFKLMTSLSYNDLITQGDVIGFFPDDATSWEWNYAPAVGTPLLTPSFPNGTGVCNNTASQGFGQSSGALNEIDVPSSLNSGNRDRSLAVEEIRRSFASSSSSDDNCLLTNILVISFLSNLFIVLLAVSFSAGNKLMSFICVPNNHH